MDAKIEYSKGEDKECRPVSIVFGHEMLEKLLYQLSPPEVSALSPKLLLENIFILIFFQF